MTNQEAISVIKTEIGQFIIDKKWKNALALAISALEKQIPKKVRIENHPKYGRATFCPNCNRMDVEFWSYCPDCGQAIDFRGD